MSKPASESAEVASPPQISARMLDRLEQGVVLVLYSLLVSRIWPEDMSTLSFASTLLLISEGAVVLFLVIRRPTDEISLRPGDWLLAASGTFLPQLVGRGDHHLFPTLGAVILLVGTIIHVGAKFSLNRSFGLVAANRGVKGEGLYRFIRHPMYAGYMLTHIGYLLAEGSLRNLLVYAAVWVLLVLRIRVEERVLFRDEAYRNLAKAVPYRLLPGVY